MRRQISVASLSIVALFAVVSCDSGGDESLTDDSATEYINENAVGESSGLLIGDTEYRAENCVGELILEPGADLECEGRTFHVEEVDEDGQLTVSSTYVSE